MYVCMYAWTDFTCRRERAAFQMLKEMFSGLSSEQ